MFSFEQTSIHSFMQQQQLHQSSTMILLVSVRVALLKKSGEEDWKNRINKKQEVVKVASSEQQPQQWEAEETGQKKVRALKSTN